VSQGAPTLVVSRSSLPIASPSTAGAGIASNPSDWYRMVVQPCEFEWFATVRFTAFSVLVKGNSSWLHIARSKTSVMPASACIAETPPMDGPPSSAKSMLISAER